MHTASPRLPGGKCCGLRVSSSHKAHAFNCVDAGKDSLRCGDNTPHYARLR